MALEELSRILATVGTYSGGTVREMGCNTTNGSHWG
jgi:hypothetical protein